VYQVTSASPSIQLRHFTTWNQEDSFISATPALSALVQKQTNARISLLTGRRLLVWVGLTSIYIAILPYWLSTLINVFASAALPVRAMVALLAIVPSGVLMGFGFPTGMQIVNYIDQRPPHGSGQSTELQECLHQGWQLSSVSSSRLAQRCGVVQSPISFSARSQSCFPKLVSKRNN
jgi:hypothetical protein